MLLGGVRQRMLFWWITNGLVWDNGWIRATDVFLDWGNVFYSSNPQTLTVLSLLPLNKYLPSGLKTIELTSAECPVNVAWSCPVIQFQTLIVVSLLALIKVLPSGLITRELTPNECPSKVLINSPFCQSQIIIVLSSLPLNNVFPSGEIHKALTDDECPSKVRINLY